MAEMTPETLKTLSPRALWPVRGRGNEVFERELLGHAAAWEADRKRLEAAESALCVVRDWFDEDGEFRWPNENEAEKAYSVAQTVRAALTAKEDTNG